jgi:hypothetical protein
MRHALVHICHNAGRQREGTLSTFGTAVVGSVPGTLTICHNQTVISIVEIVEIPQRQMACRMRETARAEDV